MSFFNNVLKKPEKFLLIVMMISMSILIFTQVFTRYILNDAITWTEEVSRYMFIWLIFISIGISFNEDKHISITILKDRLPEKSQKVLQQFVYVLIFLLSAFMAYQGIILIDRMIQLGQTSASLRIPIWFVYLSLPVGFILTMFRLTQNSILLWKDKESEV